MTGIDLKRDAVMVDIACNDPDDGSFAGRAQQIVCGYQFIELEARNWSRPPKIVELSGAIRLAGKRWPTLGSVDWIGNWCWNGYWMHRQIAADFFIWLHGRKLYQLTHGEERIFNLWRWVEPLPRDFIERVIAKPSNHEAAGA